MTTTQIKERELINLTSEILKYSMKKNLNLFEADILNVLTAARDKILNEIVYERSKILTHSLN